MTIYVHFNIRISKAAERLHNVESVQDNGLHSIKVKMQFSDNARIFSDVSHVAVTPDKD